MVVVICTKGWRRPPTVVSSTGSAAKRRNQGAEPTASGCFRWRRSPPGRHANRARGFPAEKSPLRRCSGHPLPVSAARQSGPSWGASASGERRRGDKCRPWRRAQSAVRKRARRGAGVADLQRGLLRRDFSTPTFDVDGFSRLVFLDDETELAQRLRHDLRVLAEESSRERHRSFAQRRRAGGRDW